MGHVLLEVHLDFTIQGQGLLSREQVKNAGSFVYRMRPFDLMELARYTARSNAPIADKQQLQLLYLKLMTFPLETSISKMIVDYNSICDDLQGMAELELVFHRETLQKQIKKALQENVEISNPEHTGLDVTPLIKELINQIEDMKDYKTERLESELN
jgi:hypothetical protein